MKYFPKGLLLVLALFAGCNPMGIQVLAGSCRTTPVISSLSPNSGPASGGTSVIISGSGFCPGMTVSFGGTSSSIQSLTSSKMTVTTPSHSAGSVSVVASNSAKKTAVIANGFTYLNPPASCSPIACSAATSCVSLLDGCGGVVKCGGCAKADFDPRIDATSGPGPKNRHIQLQNVIAGKPFHIPLQARNSQADPVFVASYPYSGANPAAVQLAGMDAIENYLSYDSSAGMLSGTVSLAGEYKFWVSVCFLVPYDSVGCQSSANRRLDLVHLPVLPASGHIDPPQEPAPSYSVGSIDVQLSLASLSPGILDTLNRDLSPPYGNVAPTRIFYPISGSTMPAGQFPLFIIHPGQGFHWNDYNDISTVIASYGAVVASVDFPPISGIPQIIYARAAFGSVALNWMYSQAQDSTSVFYNHIDFANYAPIGHSWGGATTEWFMPRSGARAAVLWDPMGMEANIPNWYGAKVPLLPRPNLTNLPVLMIDADQTSLTLPDENFFYTFATYRGWGTDPLHVSLASIYHEDFLDVTSPSAFPGADVRAPPTHTATAGWMARYMHRYFQGDLRYTALVSGPESFAGISFPYPVRVATTPDALTTWVDQSSRLAQGAMDSTTPNLLGGSRNSTFSSSVVTWPDIATTIINGWLPYDPTNSSQKVFSDPSYNEIHLTQAANGSATFSEGLAQAGGSFDASAYRYLRFDFIASQSMPAANFTVTLFDSNGASMTLSSADLMPGALPLTASIPMTYFLSISKLTGVNVQRLTGITWNFPAPSSQSSFVIDYIGFVP